MQSARSIQNIWTERGAENNGDWFLPGDGGGTLLNGLYGDVPLDRVRFITSLSSAGYIVLRLSVLIKNMA